jgi:hypothetical protein
MRTAERELTQSMPQCLPIQGSGVAEADSGTAGGWAKQEINARPDIPCEAAVVRSGQDPGVGNLDIDSNSVLSGWRVTRLEPHTRLMLLFSLVFYRPIIRGGVQHSGFYVLGLMWCPGAAAIITRVLYQKNLRGMGWGVGKDTLSASLPGCA